MYTTFHKIWGVSVLNPCDAKKIAKMTTIFDSYNAPISLTMEGRTPSTARTGQKTRTQRGIFWVSKYLKFILLNILFF